VSLAWRWQLIFEPPRIAVLLQLVNNVICHAEALQLADAPRCKSMIEIAIFPSRKLRRPKEKLETIARQEVLARMAVLSTDGMAV
jgi:hypothetical protein